MIDERKVVILGSTGSIGVQALEIIEKNPTLFKVVGLVAGGNNLELYEAQKQKFKVENSGLGIAAAIDIAASECDIVLNGITGSIVPTKRRLI